MGASFIDNRGELVTAWEIVPWITGRGYEIRRARWIWRPGEFEGWEHESQTIGHETVYPTEEAARAAVGAL